MVLFILACLQSFSALTHFDFKDPIQRDYFILNAETDFERVHGFSNALYGTLEVDPENLKISPKGEFRVDLRAFDSGNDFRNEIFRQKIFMTPENPFLTFTISRWAGSTPLSLKDKIPAMIKTEVQWAFRGLTKTENIDIKFTYYRASNETKTRLPGNLLKLQFASTFDLGQWKIALPPDLKVALANRWNIEMSLMGTDNFLSLLELPKTVN